MVGCIKVHITQGDLEGKAVIVSWVTEDEAGSSKVRYWSENSKQKKIAEGKVVTYKFFNYTSGFIHHCTIENLEVCSIPLLPFYVLSLPIWILWKKRERAICFLNQLLIYMCYLFGTVQHQILLWGWNWEQNTSVLVYNTSWSWSWRVIHIWSHR